MELLIASIVGADSVTCGLCEVRVAKIEVRESILQISQIHIELVQAAIQNRERVGYTVVGNVDDHSVRVCILQVRQVRDERQPFFFNGQEVRDRIIGDVAVGNSGINRRNIDGEGVTIGIRDRDHAIEIAYRGNRGVGVGVAQRV